MMIDTLRALPSNPRIILTTPITAISQNWGINDSTIVNGIVPAIRNVAKRNRLEVLDLHTLFEYSDGKQILRDGIHPTAAGAKQLGISLKAVAQGKFTTVFLLRAPVGGTVTRLVCRRQSSR